MAIKNKQIKVDTDFDINNQRMINVGDPVNDSDAINLKILNSRVSSEYSSILSNNTINEEILVGQSDTDRSIIIDYVMERGSIFQEGYIRILNDDTDVYSSHQHQSTGDIGATFNGAYVYTDTSIVISFDISDLSATDIIFKYIIRKIKI